MVISASAKAFTLTASIICSQSFAKTSEDNRCSLYLADSSVSKGGFGVFAGRNFDFGERVGIPSLGIQVIDPDKDDFEEELISYYAWNSMKIGGYGEAEEVFSLLPGIPMLLNFHPTLSNVLPGGLHDENLFIRKHDYGTGATTPYHNFTFIAKQSISAGDELFADVNDDWYKKFDHEAEKTGDDVLSTAIHYEIADQLISDLVNFYESHEIEESTFLDVIYRIKTEIISDYPGLKNLIPETIEDLYYFEEKGAARAMLNQPSLKWITKHGKCLDNLRPGVSTISGAGRGAFATRFISKGSIVSPSPLVHIVQRENLSINDGNSTKQQLLLNYCFGHRHSSLLLCPTTSVSLINHGGKNKANTIIRWSTSSKNQKFAKNFRMRAIADLEAKSSNIFEYNTKLSFDFVATRDIEKGEEVLLDYGKEWTQAWNKHVSRWEEDISRKQETYVPASRLNQMNAKIVPDLKDESGVYRHYAFLCELEPFARDEDIVDEDQDIPLEDYRANPSLNKNTWDDATRKMYFDNEFIWSWPCEVLDSNPVNTLFTVRVYQRSPPDQNNPHPIRWLTNFPRNSIKFIDKPYHSDQHVQGAFRHYIPIPDSIFPKHWRNIGNKYLTADDVNLGKIERDEDATGKLQYEKRLREAKCGLYLAPSTIEGAGNGLYVGVRMPSASIDLGPRVPIIPIADLTAEKWDAHDYTWSPNAYTAEFEADNMQVLSVNAGALANFHPGLVNVVLGDTRYQPILDRRYDPGSGAFSDYWDFSFKSIAHIEAGSEVFVSYGENWFEHRPWLGDVPLSSDYNYANLIISSLYALISSGNFSSKDFQSILRIVKKNLLFVPGTKRIFKFLSTYEDIIPIVERNGTAEATSAVRSQEWLEENGQCLDHIYVKESALPQAGRGAFSRRHIQKGDVIISSPMLNTWGREILDTFSQNSTEIILKNLIYNYQWSHPDSSLLLFPTTTAIAVNHASDRSHTNETPNAEMRWSCSDRKTQYFLQKHIDDLKKEHYTTLVLDFVALRNIQPDEEILIDYGEEWEEAWNQHMRSFRSSGKDKSNDNPHQRSSKYVWNMNEDKFNSSYHEWTKEYFTVCSSEQKPTEVSSIITIVNPKEYKDLERIPYSSYYNYKYNYHGITHDHEGFELVERADFWIPCVILEYVDGDTFDVVYFTYEEPPYASKASILRRLATLHEEDLRFVDKPYQSDLHWPKAFRHEMKIPDRIFPDLWKDLLGQGDK